MVKVYTATSLDNLPSSIRQLVEAREVARRNRDFAKSDELRSQLLAAGYQINDQAGSFELLQLGDSGKKPLVNYLVLFGSGEIAPSSVAIYRQLFLTLGKRDLHLALITTPAGFQPNVESVYTEIRDFLLTSLPDFNLTIELIRADNRESASDPQMVAKLAGADIIFCGPGSPTYAVKHLRDTPLLAEIKRCVQDGASLILASAATLAFSRHCLPVYEIYKVGEPLHWIDGLNFYQPEMTVIPHFNNREGGETLDTTYCYIGQGRASKLLSQLESTEHVIGIDEHTAYITNLSDGSVQTQGKGQTTTLS